MHCSECYEFWLHAAALHYVIALEFPALSRASTTQQRTLPHNVIRDPHLGLAPNYLAIMPGV